MACGRTERNSQAGANNGNLGGQPSTETTAGTGRASGTGGGALTGSSRGLAGAAGAPREVGDPCSNLATADPEEVVLFGLDGSSIGLVTADGRVTRSEPLLLGGVTFYRVSPNRRYIVLYSGYPTPGELALYEVGSGSIWHRELESSEDWASVTTLEVDDAGTVTATLLYETLTLALDGELTTTDTSRDGNSDGWVVRTIERETPNGPTSEPAFENLVSGELRPLSHQVVGGRPVVVDEEFYYFTRVGTEIHLVHETPRDARLVPTSLSEEGDVTSSWTLGWMWLLSSGAPVWRYEPASGEAEDLPYLEPTGSDPLQAELGEEFVLVSESGSPRYAVDLAEGKLNETPDLGTFDAWQVVSAYPWVLGVGPDGPHWQMNVQDGSARRIDLGSALDDYVEWPARVCSEPELPSRVRSVYPLDDGRFGLALRDESQARFFVVSWEEENWSPVGRGFTDVQLVSAYRVGSTWVVRGTYEDPSGVFCPFEEAPFEADPAAELLEPNTVQVVPPDPDNALVLPQQPLMHESGLCLGSGESVYDLARGSRVDLGFEPKIWFDPHE